MNTEKHCPCGSEYTFDNCCGPLIEGKKQATTAEELMRSRYVAYVVQNKEYLLATWHHTTRPQNEDFFDDNIQWIGLEILTTENGMENDNQGVVEFRARCRIKHQSAGLDEASQFVRENGHWYYVDGSSIQPVRSKHGKIGRNSPCPCGSGKKYKQCCGKN